LKRANLPQDKDAKLKGPSGERQPGYQLVFKQIIKINRRKRKVVRTRFSKVLALVLVFMMVMSSAAFGAITPGKVVSNSLTATFNVSAVPTSADVADLPELKAALANTTITTINLTSNITTAEELVVSHPVTINGNSKSITFTGDATGWQGNYVLQVYNTTGVTINKIKLSGADGGLLVNASAVTLTDSIDVSGNEFGGIEVSKGTATGLINPKLTATEATFINTTEKYGQPTIWEDKITGTVNVASVAFTTSTSVNLTQVQYYLKEANTVDPNASIAEVSTLPGLRVALANTAKTTININANIGEIDARLVVDRAMTINGNGNTLSFTDAINRSAEGTQHGILISANNVIINNLKVQMTTMTEWQGVYGIQAISSAGVVLNDVSITGADGAILVNGAEVELKGTTTVSGNEFGGIEVSKGVGVTLTPALTVTGTLVNADEAIALPTIWEDKVTGTVTCAGDDLTQIGINGQQQYYLVAGNAVPVTLEGLSGSTNATVGQEENVTITATLKTGVKSVENATLVIEVSKEAIEAGNVVIAKSGSTAVTPSTATGKLVFNMGAVSLSGATNFNITFSTAGTYSFNAYLQQ
jgi:hypothetical protein